ncbi:MAG: hypothetical protein RLZZ423_1302, partial [Cyanobacteriota bacterium]
MVIPPAVVSPGLDLESSFTA